MLGWRLRVSYAPTPRTLAPAKPDAR